MCWQCCGWIPRLPCPGAILRLTGYPLSGPCLVEDGVATFPLVIPLSEISYRNSNMPLEIQNYFPVMNEIFTVLQVYGLTTLRHPNRLLTAQGSI